MVCRRRCGWVWCRQGRLAPTSTQALPTGAATSELVHTADVLGVSVANRVDQSLMPVAAMQSATRLSELTQIDVDTLTHSLVASLIPLTHSLTQ